MTAFGRSRSNGAGLLAGLCALLVACSAALKEPRPLTDLVDDGPAIESPVDPSELADLVARAAELFARRDLDSVREAAHLFLRAAAFAGAPREALIGAVRAHLWLTDHLDDSSDRQRAATRAVEAAQWCRQDGAPDPECDYWLAAALGLQARQRSTTALSALPKIEALFKSAADRLPVLDEAGPDRALALLYVRAPGWPTGPGDPDLGLQRARQAVALRPDYPPNRLALAEALVGTGDRAAGRREFQKALDLARALTEKGDRDAPEWVAEAGKGLSGTGVE